MILKSNLQICDASKEDIPYLTTLLKNLFQIEKDFIFNEKKHTKGLELLISNPTAHLIIVKFENEIIAMITMQTIISTVTGSKVGLLEDFIVKDDFRDLGVGTHLLNYIKELAITSQFKRLQLVCDEDNEIAKEFYANKNFQKSNLTAWYYYTDN